MYALYTAVAFVGLVTLFLPVALLRRLTRGVPLNARARLGREAPSGARELSTNRYVGLASSQFNEP